MSEPELSIEKIQTLLEKSRGRDWYFQLGWGIQYWVTRETGESAVGLLVPDGHEGSATVSEMDLMAASQQIAHLYLSSQSELAALRTQRDAAQARAEAAEKQLRNGLTLEQRVNQWLNTDTGASSEAIAFATLGGRRAWGDTDPADCGDLGRCLRLIAMIPEAREGVRLLATRSEVWAELDAAWEELTQMGIEDGLLVSKHHKSSARINRRLSELRWPKRPKAQAAALAGDEGVGR